MKGRSLGSSVWRRRALGALVLLASTVLVTSFAQASPPKVSPTKPLPQDSGAPGLQQMLRRLQTTARLMQADAHPDDEDGGMLTLESRGKGESVLLLTLNRGEGGQNKVGSNLFDVLGVVRTLEVLAADRYYGVEQRFTRVADFGFSKTPEETFQKWQGHDIALGDMVRVIRTFQPDVLVARFSGTIRDGHGHHQASAILTKEAFRAAADPKRFPDQIKEGLQPWQAKKVYIGNVCGFGATSCPDGDYTLRLNTGKADPLLGMSYAQFAMEGLRHQLSQGAGAWTLDPGDRFTYYKLVDSVLPSTTDKDGHEKDFFDGMDATIPGIATNLGAEAGKLPGLASSLAAIQEDIDQASAAAEHRPAEATQFLLAGAAEAQKLAATVSTSALSPAAKNEIEVKLRSKEKQFAEAANLAAGIALSVAVTAPAAKDEDDAFMAVPGQSFEVSVGFLSDSKAEIKGIELEAPQGWKVKRVRKEEIDLEGSNGSAGRQSRAEKIAARPEYFAHFMVTVPSDAGYTRPYWHRNNPETDAINTIDDPQDATLPFPPAPLRARAIYSMGGRDGAVQAVAMVFYKEPDGSVGARALAVAPAFSVMLEPGEQVIPVADGSALKVKVAVSSNLASAAKGTLRLDVPAGWRAEPASLPLDFGGPHEKHESEFRLFPSSLKEGRTQVDAVFESAGKKYSEGYSIVTREDLNTFYYYQPAVQRVSVVDVNVPGKLKIGYVMGAGDDIPTVIQQLGMDVTVIDAARLSNADLTQYGTIVLGIRAYDTQKDLATNNRKLLDWVSAGGTLVVQYNAGVGDFNSGKFTPYSANLSRARVSVEDAAVDILAPDDSIFTSPNRITPKDFDGWVQERGLYFMDQWDDHFKPLLSTHDPGENPQKGGLLRAQYGKGTYIYTGYAFFRQLPAGVPGAIRLYVNLLDAGH
jgi:LmbE family N-acetylglucosaminyl deacetylase